MGYQLLCIKSGTRIQHGQYSQYFIITKNLIKMVNLKSCISYHNSFVVVVVVVFNTSYRNRA